MKPASHDIGAFHRGEHGRILVHLRSGAHLYGTDHAGSDDDIRGVFLPRPDDILTGQFHKAVVTASNPEGVKNTSESKDEHWMSLHHFINCALNGDTNALDWLHANPASNPNVFQTSEEWNELVVRKADFFYSRRISGLVGYAQRQAAKYGIRGSRIKTMELMLEFLRDLGDERLGTVWGELPMWEHCHRINTPDGKPAFKVCGKTLQPTAKASHYVGTFEKALAEYGKRAVLARKNEGVDWKAISHALRAAFQLRRLLQEGSYSYPLPEAPYLLKVKQGEYDFLEEVQPRLEGLISEVEVLSDASTLPPEPNAGAAWAWVASVCRIEVTANKAPVQPPASTEPPRPCTDDRASDENGCS